MSILITGGTGYIGSHTCVELLNSGYEIIILDNFSNSKPEALKRIQQITGKSPKFHNVDLLDIKELEKIFSQNNVDAVIHFAGLKSVSESVKYPLRYYQNNVTGTLMLSKVMCKYDVKKMVFSSSATVYGVPDGVPISEDSRLNPVTPYGRTKLMIEEIMRDVFLADKNWSIALLRYFNPVGAHESGKIGEDPNGIPNNLMPYITQVAVGKRGELNIYGSDYDTHDGTGIRDYIHVVDLARGHLKALEKIMHSTGVEAYNLGTGVGYSVLDVVKTFEKASGVLIPYVLSDRRPGDISKCYSDSEKAFRELGWRAGKTLEDMCRDAWNWQRNNPNGYDSDF